MRATSCAVCLLAVGIGVALADEIPSTTQQHRSYFSLPRIASYPYVWREDVGAKHLVAIGTLHSNDPHAPMYARLEKELQQARPEVVIHEALVPPDLLTDPLTEAIERAADLGFTSQLATKLGARLRSGDAPIRPEIEELLRRHSAQEVFVFLVAQRHIGNDRNPDAASLAHDYPSFVRDYLEGNGFPMRDEWRTWDGFQKAFRSLTGRPFSATTWNAGRLMNPQKYTGPVSDVERSSCEIRDRYLVEAIRAELRQHDRVVVVFGAAHIQAIEPELLKLLSPNS